MGHNAAGLRRACQLISVLLAVVILAAEGARAEDAVAVGSPAIQPISTQDQGREIDRLISSFHHLTQNDQINIDFYDGREHQIWNVSVDGTGAITLPYVGSVQVAGMLPHEAASLLLEQFRRFYKQPLIDLSVTQFGKLQVFLVGSDQPGRLITLSSGETLYGLLQRYVYNAAPDISMDTDYRQVDPGTYRRVHLIRGAFTPESGRLPGPMLLEGQGDAAVGPQDAGPAADSAGSGLLLATAPPAAVSRSAGFGSLAAYTGWTPWIEQCKLDPACRVEVFDPLQTAREGNPSALAVPLLPGDVVYLPSPQRSVFVYGVAQNGRYELLEETNLADVLRLAGTVDLNSDLCNAIIERVDECCNQSQIYVDLASGLEHLEELAAFEVQDRDVIRIQPRERRIFVLGEVNQAGAFDYNYDSIVSDYLAQAGGMTGQANTGWMALIRGNRDRRYPLEPAQVVQVNFKEIYKGHEMPADYRLLPGDTIYVPPKGASFSFSQVISALTSGFAIFKLFEDDGGSSSSNNGNTTTDGTKTTSP